MTVKQLAQEQRAQIIEILLPHVTDEDERQALIIEVFGDEPVVGQVVYSGAAVTFANNCINKLLTYDNVPAVVRLLETLRGRVGPNRQREIDAVLSKLRGTPPDLTSAPDVPEAPHLDSHLFISYSRKDIAFVDKLRGDLKARGVPYWIDQEGLSPGTPNWERAIRAAIETSSAVLWVVSPAANESEYVFSELAIAEMYKRKIYPVWAFGDNWVDCVPMGKHRIQFVDMRGNSYAAGLEQLLVALGKADSELIVPPEEAPDLPPDAPPRNPYKGLEAFHEEDVDDFFGREALVSSLADRLGTQIVEDRARFLAVLGPSGAGKSSVVMAGLLPALKNKDAVPGSENWHYLPTITPGAHPMESLAGKLGTLLPSVAPETILTKLYTRGHEYFGDVFAMFPPEKRVVLYIDQFEELFTLAKDDGERQEFISLLSGAATEPNGKLIVLLSMRADFLDYPLNYPQLGTLFNNYTELVQPMSIPELRDAIQKPAQQSGLSFDDGLVADVVFALRGQDKALAGALPLLQFTLERLYEERDGTRLTRSSYEQMGGVSGAIGTHSEAVFAALPEAAQDSLGKVFLPLVNIDEETGEPTRRRALLEAVTADPNAKRLVDAFVDNGLLQRGREGERRYLEVTHEALLRSWERLVDWIDSSREDQLTIRRMEREAGIWQEREQQEHLLPNAEEIAEFYAACKRLGRIINDPMLQAFTEPEQERLLRELDELQPTPENHERRRDIGDRLSVIDDPRPGVGVREDGTPEIEWLPVAPGGKIRIEYGGGLGSRDRKKKTTIFNVEPFYIARYLVTYAQFQAFEEAADGYQNPAWWQGMPQENQKQKLSQQRTKSLNNPRDSVSWYQSVAFARWLNQRLGGLELPSPSGSGEPLVVGSNAQVRLAQEWEWQWVAQNGTERRKYPWGDWQEGYANTSEAGLSRAVAVGMYPHGVAVCGALDMAGNLREWCLNEYDKPSAGLDLQFGNSRVLRGGAFSSQRADAACGFRFSLQPYFDYINFGLRVVVSSPID